MLKKLRLEPGFQGKLQRNTLT